MSFYRLTARTAALILVAWLMVALVLHLKAERAMQKSTRHSTTTSSSIAHKLSIIDTPLGAVDFNSSASFAQSMTGAKAGNSKRQTAVVVAKSKFDNATWLEEYFPQWEKHIYSVDDWTADLTVPVNKGRESMVYLSYIIDKYDNLPDNVLFIHPNRYQWHNDDADYDGVSMLRRFQISYLEQEGYVNIRCAWALGCPHEIKPLEEEGEHREQVHAGGDYKQAFEVLFPGRGVPTHVGVSCCSQFAATKEKIRERGKSDYVGYKRWLLETDLADSISGRVMEYSWHIIFGKGPIHCPPPNVCYCKVFGLCELECDEQGSCPGQYVLPPYSTLPEGWPYRGWFHEYRERAAPED
ncbi:hypothetical protein N0V90_001353 [Kalmusia sp. IMI 367209]|nr:hypothetical protein N0V90_001353 [Kalmusia sp. IMI 367209]